MGYTTHFPWVSGFNYAENKPIANIDLHGLQKLSMHVLGEFRNAKGHLNFVAGEIGLDLGNQNRIDYRLYRMMPNSISAELGLHGSYTPGQGFGDVDPNFGSSSVDEAIFRADRPPGIALGEDVVGSFLFYTGMEKARNAITPGSVEEAMNLSEEERQLNSQLEFVFNSIEELYESGRMTPLADFFNTDKSPSTAINSEGEEYKRLLTNTFRGHFPNIDISHEGISFKGTIVISFTQQQCVENCD